MRFLRKDKGAAFLTILQRHAKIAFKQPFGAPLVIR